MKCLTIFQQALQLCKKLLLFFVMSADKKELYQIEQREKAVHDEASAKEYERQ